jgi:NADPH:quinone reductase-like Zn-dependent oxidoreductase
VGDRIAGVVHGGLFPDKGAFAKYLKVHSDLAWRPPPSRSHQNAATYGISAVTAMQALYTKLDFPWPGSNNSTRTNSTILVYAGSTAASLFAIQLAKLAGYTVVTTCSPHNFDLVRNYGADAVYDYHSQSALEDIEKDYSNIDRAFDGISLKESTNFCSSVVEKSGGKVVVLLDTVKAGKRLGVEVIHILMYTLLGEPFAFLKPIGPSFEAEPADREALAKFYKNLPGLVEKVRPPPIEVVTGGFDGLLGALDLLRKKKVSGKKLIVDLAWYVGGRNAWCVGIFLPSRKLPGRIGAGNCTRLSSQHWSIEHRMVPAVYSMPRPNDCSTSSIYFEIHPPLLSSMKIPP